MKSGRRDTRFTQSFQNRSNQVPGFSQLLKMDQRTEIDLKESAASLTMHGFGRLLSTKSKAMRCIWLLLMLFFVSLVILTVTPTIQSYFRSPSLTKVETVRVSEMKIPAITVCGPSLSKAKVIKYAMGKNIKITYNEELGIIENVDELLMTASSVEDLVFDEKSMYIIKPKKHQTDIERILVAYQGYCYKINANGTARQRSADPEIFFDITLFLDMSEGINFFSYPTDAVDVIIQDHRQFPSLDSGTVLAPAGHRTLIEIKKTEITRLKPPYPSKCTNGEKMKLLFKGDYTVGNCRLSCFLNKASKKCSNIPILYGIFLPKAMRRPFPVNRSQITCTTSILKSLQDSNYASCNCELPCVETKFHKYSSSAKLQSSDPRAKQIVAISVFFGDMEFEKITEFEMYTKERLIGEIGGQMGIWIGASIFSVLELIYLFVQFAGFLCRRKRRKSFNLEKGVTKEVTDSIL